MKPLRVSFQDVRRIVFRINGYGVEEDALPHQVTQKFLNLGQSRRLERAVVLATRVDELDSHDFVLEQIIVESDSLPVLSSHANVGKIICVPGRAPGRSRAL